MPRDQHLSVRMSGPGLELVDAIATETATDRSKVARALLGAALHSPAAVREAKTRLRSDLL